MRFLVLSHPHDPLAHFVATAFHQSFISLGHQSTIQIQYESGYDVCLVMYAHIWYNLPKDNTYKIAYNWETLLNKKWHKKIGRTLGQFNCILEYSADNLKVHLPIKQLYCPLGYHSSFEVSTSRKDYDNVSFIGMITKRRKLIIQSIEQSLNLKVWCAHSKTDYVHSEKLGEKILNTLIHLNIHQNQEFSVFESQRVITMLLNNRCFVVSDPSCDSPLISGEHYIETNDFPKTVKYYLEHPEEREQIAQQGYEFVKTKYRLEDHIAKCLREI